MPGTDGATNSGVIDAPPLGGFVAHPAALINVINSGILYIGDDNTAGEDGVILDSTTQQFITTRASSTDGQRTIVQSVYDQCVGAVAMLNDRDSDAEWVIGCNVSHNEEDRFVVYNRNAPIQREYMALLEAQ